MPRKDFRMPQIMGQIMQITREPPRKIEGRRRVEEISSPNKPRRRWRKQVTRNCNCGINCTWQKQQQVPGLGAGGWGRIKNPMTAQNHKQNSWRATEWVRGPPSGRNRDWKCHWKAQWQRCTKAGPLKGQENCLLNINEIYGTMSDLNISKYFKQPASITYHKIIICLLIPV